MAGTDILSRIQILLDADTANFSAGMQKAKGESKSTFESIRESANKMGMGIAASAASAAVALGAMAMETANQAAELEKYALRSNTTTQEFQKMAVGAQAYGVEQEKLSDMMKDFNEKLGELTSVGAGGGVDFFEKIAVKTEGSAAAAEKLILKMQKLSGPEALQLYVDKLEEAGVNQQQMSYFLENMASDMTDLVPLLVNGGEGMNLYGEAAERAGLMSEDAIEQAKILKEQVYLLNLQFSGVKNQLMQAVIPAFVDITQAFFNGSEQGLQFADAANDIADGLRYVAKVAIGAATSVQMVGKTLGGLAATGVALASGDLSGAKAIGAAMLEDLSTTALNAAERMDQVTKGTASSTAKQLAAIRSVHQAASGVNTGLGDLVEKQNKAAESASKLAKATSDSAKAYRDQKQAIEEAQRLIYEYGDEHNRITMDLEKEIERITKTEYLKSDAKSRMIKDAEDLASARYKLYVAELDLETSEHHLAEEEKLKKQLSIDKLRLEATKGLHKAELEERKNALDQWHRLDLANIEEQKRARAESAVAAWGGTYSDMTGQGEDHALSQKRFSRIDESQELFDAKMDLAETAEQREAIWFEHNERMQLIEQEYFRARANMQMQYGMSYVQGAAGVMAQVFGEQSAAYQAMFAMQKAFAIAEVMVNAPKSFSKAYDAMIGIPYVGPFVAPAAGAAAVAIQMAQAATIGSVSFQPTGMAHDGIDRIPEEGSWWLDKGERVLTEQTSSKLDKTLDELRATNNQGPMIGDQSPATEHHYHINAIDTQSFKKAMKKHNRHVAGGMKDYARNFGR